MTHDSTPHPVSVLQEPFWCAAPSRVGWPPTTTRLKADMRPGTLIIARLVSCRVRCHGHLVSVLVSRLYQWPESQYTPTPRSPPSSTTQPPPTPCPAPSPATVADCQVAGSRDLARQGK